MFTIKGKCSEIKIHTIAETLEESVEKQLNDIANQEWTEGTKIEIMPDFHSGKGSVIGTTIKLNGKADPMTVGVDIGCAVSAVKIAEKNFEPEKLENIIEEYIPSGINIGTAEHVFPSIDDLIAPVDKRRELMALGSLGGGNHFIEIDRDSSDNLWLIVHCGSRHLGLAVAQWHKKQMSKINKKMQVEKIIKDLKNQGREKEIEQAIKTAKYPSDYLKGESFERYIHDMQIAQAYSEENHRIIEDIIMFEMGWHMEDRIMTMHNYIDTENMILRKGAVSAQKGERFLCPMNMRDGTLLCIGKGNEDWNCSAPHGAGRIMSRRQAKDHITQEQFTEAMNDIWSASVCESTVDESPFAYKPMYEIVSAIEETADVTDIMKPVFNFKAH